jgi:hypothetical protein
MIVVAGQEPVMPKPGVEDDVVDVQDVAGLERGEHVRCGAAVMSLTLGQLQCDGQAAGIDQRVDLGGYTNGHDD